MAASLRSNAARNYAADAVAARCNNGYIRIYSGTRPATPDTALSGNTLLAEPRFGATAFADAVDGVATANAITQDASANNTGTASFARLFESDGTTVVMDLDTSSSAGSDRLVLSTTAIAASAPVSISSLTYTQAA